MNLSKIKKIHMIGIKGVGMTSLAQFFVSKNIIVSGSDTDEVFMTDVVLKKYNIKIFKGFNPKNISNDVDLIIYSTAYTPEKNKELRYALDGKIKVLKYAEALAILFNSYYGVAIIGSHGKTTTTAWLGFVLQKSDKNPNVITGARIPQFEGAGLVGNSDIMIAEADEYQNKLKYLNPKGVLLNNIDYDHPDFFQTKNDYENVFIEFIKKIPAKGFLVANFDDIVIKKYTNVNCRGKIISYALKNDANFVAYNLRNIGGEQYFSVRMKIEDEINNLGDFNIKLKGEHNIYNALAVIAAAIELDVELVDIRKYLSDFQGAARRMEIIGRYHGALIIDDYAHHPTEIKATISAIKKDYSDKNLIVVFHPHTFSRTKVLIDDFAKSFDLADEIIILDIYGSAREDNGGAHSLDLVEKIKKNKSKKSIKIFYIPTLNECERYLRSRVNYQDIVLLMGAGDVFKIGVNLIKCP